MKQPALRLPFQIVFRRVKWRLTLSYLAVTLAAIFILAWWGLVVGTIYLHQLNPQHSWMEVLRSQILPALGVIFRSGWILIIPAALVSMYFGFLNARWVDQRLDNLHKAAQAWQAGDFSVKVYDDSGDEISSFGQALNRMASELERLMGAHAELAALDERNRLARDLHDSVKQQITAAAFQIEAAASLLDQNIPAARACLAESEHLTRTAHQELNAIIFELRPASAKPGDLAQALGAYVDSWRRQNPVELQLEIQEGTRLDPAIQQEILRFFQEALSNVARHSRAAQVKISLARDERDLVLTIRDDGCGFEPEKVSGNGLGLKSMRERITRLGGQLSLESQPGRGTRLTTRVPLQRLVIATPSHEEEDISSLLASREAHGKDA